jgi:fructose-bisphosphate aldolase, class II
MYFLSLNTTTHSLAHIRDALGKEYPLVLHGTHPLTDDLLRVGMQKGLTKINQNRNLRLQYMKFVEENAGTVEMTILQEQGVEVYSQEIERMMVSVFGSAGKA